MSTRQARPVSARRLAASVLVRVNRDQAFAAPVLDAELNRSVQMSSKDKRLATQLVYGPLRCERFLLEQLSAYAPRGLDKLDLETRVHLLIAAYQLLCLDRIPAFAVVSEAVKIVRYRRGQGLARFVNALLRKLAEQVERQGRPSIADAVKASVDSWLLEHLVESLGSERDALAMLTAGPIPPPIGLRVRLSANREVWRQRIKRAAPESWVGVGKVSPLALHVVGAGKPQLLPGYEEGFWTVQEEGSQMIALALGAREGETVLDACAGRGNKALLLAEQVGQSGQADAADLHPSKLDVLRERAEQLHLPVRDTYPIDWSRGTGSVPDTYDRVLIDAPCSGVGTIRRRPELGRRNLKDTFDDITSLQVSILLNAASRCKPGGRLVYAVCSVLEEEAEGVIERALAKGAKLRPEPFDAPEWQRIASEKTTFRLLPHEHGTDGYFVASFRVGD